MRRLLLAAGLTWGLTGQALADPLTALNLIENAGAAGVFEPAGEDGAVRHLGSGLVCHFSPAGEGRIVLFEGLPRGDDVACEFSDGAQNLRLYATRLPQRPGLGELVAAVDAAVRRGAPDAARYSGALSIAASHGLPASQSVQYLAPAGDGARDFLRVSVAQVGEWTIKMRYRAPAPDDATAQRLEERAELTWRATLAEFVR